MSISILNRHSHNSHSRSAELRRELVTAEAAVATLERATDVIFQCECGCLRDRETMIGLLPPDCVYCGDCNKYFTVDMSCDFHDRDRPVCDVEVEAYSPSDSIPALVGESFIVTDSYALMIEYAELHEYVAKGLDLEEKTNEWIEENETAALAHLRGAGIRYKYNGREF